MYAFQICNIPSADEKIIHYEFLGCIAEDMEGEEEQEDERESNKRSKFIALIARFIVHTTCSSKTFFFNFRH